MQRFARTMAPPPVFMRTGVNSKSVRGTAAPFRSTALPPLQTNTTRFKKSAKSKKSNCSFKSDATRKPRNAYAFFVHCFFKEYKRNHPGKKINMIKVSKKCAVDWNGLNARKKETYYNMAAMDKSRCMVQRAAAMNSSDSMMAMQERSYRGGVASDDGGYFVGQDDLVDIQPGCSYCCNQRNKIHICDCCQRQLSEVHHTPSPRQNAPMLTTRHREARETRVKRPRQPIPEACFYPSSLERATKNPSVASGRPSRMVQEPETKIRTTLQRCANVVAVPGRNIRTTQYSQRVPPPPPQCSSNNIAYDSDDYYEDFDEEEVDEEMEEQPRFQQPCHRLLPMRDNRGYVVEERPRNHIPPGVVRTDLQRPSRLNEYDMTEDEDMLSDDADEETRSDRIPPQQRRVPLVAVKRRTLDPAGFQRPVAKTGNRPLRQVNYEPSIAQKRKPVRAEDPRQYKQFRQVQPDYYT